jgi:DNA-binding XRE family transcriptional regulator
MPDKRFKPLTGGEELDAREVLLADIDANPGRPIPEVIRLVRTSLHLTLAEYSKLCGVSMRGLQDIERGVKSPTLDTVAKLLRPMGLRAGVVTRGAVQRAEAALVADQGD